MSLPPLPLDPLRRSKPARFWPQVAILAWTLAYLTLCGRTLLLKHDAHSVYPVFTTAADHWLAGDDLYVRGKIDEFRYSPLIAAAFVPLAMLPERLGHFLWRSINFLTLVIGLWWCCEVGIPRRLTPNQTAAVFLLALPLAVGSLNNAQSNPLVIGLLLIAVAATLQRYWTTAALAITVATLFKVYPLSLGMLLLLLYPARLGWRLVVCLAAGLLLPLLLQHAGYVIDQYHTWLHYMATEDRQHGPIADWYKDFRAVWRIYVSPMSPRAYQGVELAAAAVIAAATLLGRWRGRPEPWLLAMTLALACCWMTALGPATESSTYVLLAPVVAWTLVQADARRHARAYRVGYGAVYALFLAAQTALWLGQPGRQFRDRLQPLPIAAAALLFLLLAEAVGRYSRQRPDDSAGAQNTFGQPSAPHAAA
jgi:hypothetical protein